jgi:galacturan 1,4-alpha-galacturonidase
VGSLGQYRNEIDIVENLYIYNISMTNATDAARIKVWPGQPADSGIDNAGGGAGYVKNVTYEVMGISNVDSEYMAAYCLQILPTLNANKILDALSLIQCYGSPSQAFCDANPVSHASSFRTQYTVFLDRLTRKYPITGFPHH